MINNKDDNTEEFNAINYDFIGLFLLTFVICFCVFAYFKWFKGKYTNNKKDILIIIKMSIKSLKIKTNI